ncbi:hypothetical protein L7F22_035826 [Adiantum nelumboides]|nr:hypothetical protein [Adiantum nelumboides]
MVKEKRKRDEETAESSKRPTEASSKKEEGTSPKPTPEVNIEDAPKKKKQGKTRGFFYKLKSDIELATDLKVFEERILNIKVKMTLGNILGIAKREFHEEIIDIIKMIEQIPNQEVKLAAIQKPDILEVRHLHFYEDEDEEIIPRGHFTRTHWARATPETIVKLGDLEEPVLALVDHGSEINLMATSLHQKGKWPVDVDHGWRIRTANMLSGDLYGACVNVKVTIGDVCDEHNFCIQKQSYITTVRIETKVLDDGSAYARSQSSDSKRAVQFLTVCVNHAKNKDSLRDHSLPRIREEF